MKLSDVRLKKAKPTNKTYKLFDGGGLYVEVTTSGSKHWKLKYSYLGKEKKLAIGLYPLASLKEARDKRDEAKKLLTQNIDPNLIKQEMKCHLKTDSENTFKVIAKEWHQTLKARITEKHFHDILHRLELYIFPTIGDIPIKSITPLILLNALRQLEAKGILETTKRMRQYCSQVFCYGVITARCERDVSVDIKGALQKRRIKHQSALDSRDLPEFLKRLDKNEAELFLPTRLAIELLLLTFVRTKELIEAKWSEFDLIISFG